MKKLIIFICIPAFLFLSCQKAQIVETRVAGVPIPWTDSSNIHPKNNALKALLEKYRRKGLPGISLLVNDASGTWVGAAGKADIENKMDFSPGTISKAASITKLFVATIVFRLMEDSAQTGIGYNALNTRISQWLPPRIINKLPNGSLITLGQCMNHETGVPDLIEQDAFQLAVLNNPNKKWESEELLAFIYDKPALFHPSDSAIYSNTNTVLVKLVMEAVTGKKHVDLMKQYIFQPLGLLHSYYQPYDELPNSVAQGYFDLFNNNTIVNVSNLVTGSGNGYGGLYSTIFDLHKFIDALLIKQTFLKPKSLAIMNTFGKLEDPNYYGYGLQKTFLTHGINYGIGHKGRDLGYTANMFYFPNKAVTHIFFINYGTDSKSNLRQVFYDFQEELVTLTLQ